MKSKIREWVSIFAGFWIIVMVVLVWLQGGGRYPYNANDHIRLLGTAVLAAIIVFVIFIYIALKNKFSKIRKK
jgi:hypothetical protein